MKYPHIFGIRHLSPAGAYHLLNFLDEKKPKLVLVEGPSDFNDQIKNMIHKDTRLPIAILAYTKETPVRTILYPFAEYSPEYQAILWCNKNKRACRFFDLPSEVFLALHYDSMDKSEAYEEHTDVNSSKDKNTEGIEQKETETTDENIYELLDRVTGEDGHDTFWERVVEHTAGTDEYHEGVNLFGKEIREFSWGTDRDLPETIIREAFMRRCIAQAVGEGYEPEEIVVVTGAYHVEGLQDEEADCMTEEELKSLPRIPTNHTLMPYSNYRLSTRSGYGAGNKAPAYFSMLWEGIKNGDLNYTAYKYLSSIAGYQRKNGNPVSSAEVIEGVRLAEALCSLRGGRYPVLRDLRDAAISCLGKGSFSQITLAVADTEIGTQIGALPDGVSRTSIQDDFYRQLKELKIEKYRDIVLQDLKLDLRENRNVKSESAAFLDLHRSFFLNQLRVLNIGFASLKIVSQENATWAEHWTVQWTPEAEIELVEAALKGDTVILATSFAMRERVEKATAISEIALVIEDAFSCGMSKEVTYAVKALQAMTVDAASISELATTAVRLSNVISYGTIRQLEEKDLIPILKQIFYHSCLILTNECVCDDTAAGEIKNAIEGLNKTALLHDFLDTEQWIKTLREIALRDDLNTKLSGYSMAILLERGIVDNGVLKLEVSRRLSKGAPAELGAGWFEGLAMKNRYALIARLSLWESLDAYIQTLDDEEFKRALIFLRRAFADFSAGERDEIAENMGEIWGLNVAQVSEAVNGTLTESEQKIVENLDDFDFDL